jgi:RNA polymerase sigma factor (sigma-70 family)
MLCHLPDSSGDDSGGMLTQRTVQADEYNDTELVARSLAGDREAFSRIVTRYQTLICSLAYSRIGNLGQSEDVAQETFITAWKHLRLLREPAKLRAWLCGIVRNRIRKNLSREGRQPAHNAESLEQVNDSPAAGALPSEDAINREEEAILWRSLGRIPETYREPLILFYREHQSIETVALELDLSEDAVKQRLSRGRRLLQQEVHTFVENTLRRSAPDSAFAGAVLSALPAGPAAALGVGAGGKGTMAAKTGALAAWFGPILGILGGMGAHWLIVRAAPTARERRLKKIAFGCLWCVVLAWCLPGLLAMRALSQHLEWNQATYFRVMAGFWWCYAWILATLAVMVFRRVAAIHRENGQNSMVAELPGGRPKAVAGVLLVAGVHLAYFSWLIGLALQARDESSAGVIAGVMAALAARNIARVRHASGTAAVRAVARHQALIWGVMLVILNVRLASWLMSIYSLTPAEMRRLLPAWIIPLLTLALIAWVWLLLKMTGPQDPQPLSPGQ